MEDVTISSDAEMMEVDLSVGSAGKKMRRELKRRRIITTAGPEKKKSDNHHLCVVAGYDVFKFVSVDIDLGLTRAEQITVSSDTSIPGNRCHLLRLASIASRLFLFDYTEDPRGVRFCQLTRRPGGTVSYGNWKDGPMFNGPKPNPMIVTVNGKIYALSGSFYRRDYDKSIRDQLGHRVFEVLSFDDDDDDFSRGGGRWHDLPDPPFMSLYKYNGYNLSGPLIRCFTVIGSTIYIQLMNPNGRRVITLYSFDTIGRGTWKSHGKIVDNEDDGDLDESCGLGGLIVANLKKCSWSESADVVDNKLFQTNLDHRNTCRPEVYAYNLAIKGIVIPEEEYDEYVGEHLVLLPVMGLSFEDVMNALSLRPRGPLPFSSIVTHLVENTYCLLAIFPHSKNVSCTMRVCIFDLEEEVSSDDIMDEVMHMVTREEGSFEDKPPMSAKGLRAKNVVHKDFVVGDDFNFMIFNWCKVHLDG